MEIPTDNEFGIENILVSKITKIVIKTTMTNKKIKKYFLFIKFRIIF